MPRNYIKKRPINIKATINKALLEVQMGHSIRKTAKKYGISFGLLQKCKAREKLSEEILPESRAGLKTCISMEVENVLANAIRRMENMGLGPTINEMKNIISDYITGNNIRTNFKNNMPGSEWARNFMQRHQFKLKKGTPMNIARKRVTSDPFVIYDFYEKLGKVLKDLDIEKRPECIWNFDETGFPLDPSKKHIVGTVGSHTIRLTSGSNRENITVLACCCANGTAMDPMIVYKGKRVLTSWLGTGAEVLQNTTYAASESGWMTANIFEDFFKIFARITRDVRPLLVILDGHLSHTSIGTIELAMRENITIMKLPSHCTDLLQPLDVACFAPLKMRYDTELTDYVQRTSANASLRKDIFVNMLCKVWKLGLSSSNIQSGFKETGIFPLCSKMFDEKRLDPVKLKTFNTWVSKGRPLTSDNSPDLEIIEEAVTVEREGNEVARQVTIVDGAIIVGEEEDTEGNVTTGEASFHSPITSTPMSFGRKNIPASDLDINLPGTSKATDVRDLPGTSKDSEIEEYLKNVPLKFLLKEIQRRCDDGPNKQNKSIEEVLHARGRVPDEKPKSRRALQTKSLVVTTEDIVRNKKEEALRKSTKGQRGRPKTKSSTKVQKKKIEETFTSSDSDELLPSDTSSEFNDEIFSQHQPEETLPKQIRKEESFKPPIITEESQHKYYAVYYEEPKLEYYWGKVEKVFSQDEEEEISQVEMKFLKKNSISSDPANWSWKDNEDVAIIKNKYVFYGPQIPEIKKNILYFNDVECSKVLKTIPFPNI